MRLGLTLLLAAATLPSAAPAKEKDFYPDFSALARGEKEGTDFHVEVKDRRSKACVLAIHGGRIEEGTAELAERVAGADWSSYILTGLKPANNRVLHVTSTHFDDPRAVALVRSAALAISIHGFKEPDADIACIGGANSALRDRLAARLERSGLPLKVETPCARFTGAAAANIVNRGASGGVQIELSAHLRRRLLKEPALMDSLAAAIRNATAAEPGAL